MKGHVSFPRSSLSMAFFRQLKNSLLNFSLLFKKRKLLSSENEKGQNNSKNSPLTTHPEQQQESSVVDDNCPELSKQSNSTGGVFQTKRTQTLETAKDKECRDKGFDQQHRNAPKDDIVGHPESSVTDSDSEVEETGVSRCQCSKNFPCDPTLKINRKIPINFSAEAFYGEKDNANLPCLTADRNEIFPSTSQLKEPQSDDGGCRTDTDQSSLDDQMEEMVSMLKTRGSLSRSRRSRSRSRRSRARQFCETGVVINNVRVVQTFPRRETDSDDSNTESRTSLPLTFFRSSGQPRAPSYFNNQSNSSFHSATESDSCVTPQTSSGNIKSEEDAERAEEEMADVNNVALNMNRATENSISLQIQDLSSYGPEDFVLDLLLAMCRGSWYDIL